MINMFDFDSPYNLFYFLGYLEEDFENGLRQMVIDSHNGKRITKQDIDNHIANHGYVYHLLPQKTKELIDMIDMDDNND